MSTNVYRYTIDLDERGELLTHVDQLRSDGTDALISEYRTEDLRDLVEDGFISDPRDHSQIADYLIDAAVIPHDSLMLAGHEEPDWEALQEQHSHSAPGQSGMSLLVRSMLVTECLSRKADSVLLHLGLHAQDEPELFVGWDAQEGELVLPWVTVKVGGCVLKSGSIIPMATLIPERISARDFLEWSSEEIAAKLRLPMASMVTHEEANLSGYFRE